MRIKKRAIALLITVLFVMAITVAIGVGLKQVKEASWHEQEEMFMFQTSVIMDDILNILKNSDKLDKIVTDKSSDELFSFISNASFLPFQSSNFKASIQIKSARSKFNPNSLAENPTRVNVFKEYLNTNMVNGEDYMNILLDIMGGIKEDGLYKSGIFNEKPYLFRDYVSSQKQLNEVNDFYIKTYRDINLKNINFENIFYFSKSKDNKIDVNYATKQIWEIMLECDEKRAEQLSFGSGTYSSLEDLGLNDTEKINLARFDVSYFEPYLDVSIEISQDTQSAKIEFEYDISTKKGSNFVYEI